MTLWYGSRRRIRELEAQNAALEKRIDALTEAVRLIENEVRDSEKRLESVADRIDGAIRAAESKKTAEQLILEWQYGESGEEA